MDRFWQEMREQGRFIDSPRLLDIPRWSTLPFSEGPSTGWIDNPTPPPLPKSPSHPLPYTPPPLTASPPAPLPLPEYHLPPADTLSTTGHQSATQQSSSSGSNSDLLHPPGQHPPVTADIRTDDESLEEGEIRQSTPVQPSPNPELHSPAAADTPMDEILDVPMNGEFKHLTSVQRPPSPEPHSLQNLVQPSPNPEQPSPAAIDSSMDEPLEEGKIRQPTPVQRPPVAAEMPMDEFLDMLMKGEAKRPTPVQPSPNLVQPPPNPEPHPLAATDSSMDVSLKEGEIKWPTPVQPPNPEPHPPAAADMHEFSDMLMKGETKQSTPVQPPPNLKPHSPAAADIVMDESFEEGKVKQPTPVQRPPVAAEIPTDEFLDMLMKGPARRPTPVQPPPNPEPHSPAAAEIVMDETLEEGKVKQPTPLQRPPVAAEIPTDEFLDMLMKGQARRPTPVQPPPNPEPHPPAAADVLMGESLDEGKVKQPTLVQRPPVATEMPIDEFLDMLMKGKARRPTPVQPPPNPEPHPPAAADILMDEPLEEGEIKRPTPVQRPPVAADIQTDEFLDMLMKGKAKQPTPVQRPPVAPEISTDEFLDMLMKGKARQPNPVQPPPNPEPHPPAAANIPMDESLEEGEIERPTSVQPLKPNLPNSKPRPPTTAAVPLDEFLDMLMRGKFKRTFPALVL